MLKSFKEKERYCFDDLRQIMKILRSSEGCPWDREQDHHSIRRNFVEEVYEVLEAIDQENPNALKEELGDVLLQVVFHSEMESEKGVFDIDGVCDGICKKLIQRHPHIFASTTAETKTTAEVLSNWEEIKQREKGQTTKTQTLESVPKVLPALMRAEKLQSRAQKAGVDMGTLFPPVPALRNSLERLSRAIEEKDSIQADVVLGDMLFSLATAARLFGLDPEFSLYQACDRFMEHFSAAEQLAVDSGLWSEGNNCKLPVELWEQAAESTFNKKPSHG